MQMGVLSLEHGKFAYRADLGVYALVCAGIACLLVVDGPSRMASQMFGLFLCGLAGWTLIEYLIHRFIMHAMQPFSGWHQQHHQHPTALISTPTVVSFSLIAVLVYLPALLAFGWWRACALTLGVVLGYFTYGIAHHAAHNWNFSNRWFKHHKRVHALHHHLQPPGSFGVTTSLWDHVFRSAGRSQTNVK
jgi:hypothetical protein